MCCITLGSPVRKALPVKAPATDQSLGGWSQNQAMEVVNSGFEAPPADLQAPESSPHQTLALCPKPRQFSSSSSLGHFSPGSLSRLPRLPICILRVLATYFHRAKVSVSTLPLKKLRDCPEGHGTSPFHVLDLALQDTQERGGKQEKLWGQWSLQCMLVVPPQWVTSPLLQQTQTST